MKQKLLGDAQKFITASEEARISKQVSESVVLINQVNQLGTHIHYPCTR